MYPHLLRLLCTFVRVGALHRVPDLTIPLDLRSQWLLIPDLIPFT